MGYFSYLRFPSFIILSTKVHSPGKKKKKQKSPRPVRRKSFFALFYPFLPIFSEHFFLKQIALICIEPSLPFGRSYAFPDFSAFPDSAASSPLPVSSFACFSHTLPSFWIISSSLQKLGSQWKEPLQIKQFIGRKTHPFQADRSRETANLQFLPFKWLKTSELNGKIKLNGKNFLRPCFL